MNVFYSLRYSGNMTEVISLILSVKLLVKYSLLRRYVTILNVVLKPGLFSDEFGSSVNICLSRSSVGKRGTPAIPLPVIQRARVRDASTLDVYGLLTGPDS